MIIKEDIYITTLVNSMRSFLSHDDKILKYCRNLDKIKIHYTFKEIIDKKYSEYYIEEYINFPYIIRNFNDLNQYNLKIRYGKLKGSEEDLTAFNLRFK